MGDSYRWSTPSGHSLVKPEGLKDVISNLLTLPRVILQGYAGTDKFGY
jgi:hypothetical protein